MSFVRPIGTILQWSDGEREMWFVVDRLGPRGGPHGPCFFRSGDGKVGGDFALGSKHMEIVPEDRVPDPMWAELAKFRLLK